MTIKSTNLAIVVISFFVRFYRRRWGRQRFGRGVQQRINNTFGNRCIGVLGVGRDSNSGGCHRGNGFHGGITDLHRLKMEDYWQPDL